ncbi:hypothetical protein DPMN_123510 [Dreissena polymorpha]|uniref:Uncharacterized protein n=1 Tax=Dreissena polymorpha TaxID=45954 RepID=A0A9D4GTV8_DREPO|nr:hypothetical protein DPMN_123510 [Dreissena polymorpha]
MYLFEHSIFHSKRGIGDHVFSILTTRDFIGSSGLDASTQLLRYIYVPNVIISDNFHVSATSFTLPKGETVPDAAARVLHRVICDLSSGGSSTRTKPDIYG